MESKIKPGVLQIAGAFLAVYLIWGSTYLAIRFAIDTIPPLMMVGARFVLAGIPLYGILRLMGAPRPSLAEWRVAGLLGVLLLSVGTSNLLNSTAGSACCRVGRRRFVNFRSWRSCWRPSSSRLKPMEIFKPESAAAHSSPSGARVHLMTISNFPSGPSEPSARGSPGGIRSAASNQGASEIY